MAGRHRVRRLMQVIGLKAIHKAPNTGKKHLQHPIYPYLKSACGSEHALDLVYVLDRGLINVDHGIGKLEGRDGGAITNFYFSILNSIQREARRRDATPFERYTQPAKNTWIKD